MSIRSVCEYIGLVFLLAGFLGIVMGATLMAGEVVEALKAAL